MEPLLDQDTERCGHKTYDEAARPERVDSYEGRRGRECVWSAVGGLGRVNERIGNRKTSELDRHLHQDLVGRVSGIVLEFGIRFDYERGQYRREQTGLWLQQRISDIGR